MKLRLTSIVLALCLSALTALQAQLLWKVAAPDSPKVSYLFGTHHFAPLSVISQTKGLEQALASADKVYGEIEMGQMTAPETLMKMQQALMAPADSTLDKVFTPMQIDSIMAVAKTYMGPMVNIGMLKQLKPIGLSLTLTQLISNSIYPINPNQQLDTEIQRLAKEMGKPVGSLETVDKQIAVLFTTPIAQQAEDLMFAIRNHDLMKQTMRELNDAYMGADLDKITAFMTDPKYGFSDESAALLIDERNNCWIEILAREIPAESLFVAVGAGHLGGKNGLIEQLRTKGFNVEPVQ